jgi:hypothetical protein
MAALWILVFSLVTHFLRGRSPERGLRLHLRTQFLRGRLRSPGRGLRLRLRSALPGGRGPARARPVREPGLCAGLEFADGCGAYATVRTPRPAPAATTPGPRPRTGRSPNAVARAATARSRCGRVIRRPARSRPPRPWSRLTTVSTSGRRRDSSGGSGRHPTVRPPPLQSLPPVIQCLWFSARCRARGVASRPSDNIAYAAHAPETVPPRHPLRRHAPLRVQRAGADGFGRLSARSQDAPL